MRYLILFEWDKSVDEITFVYQNTVKYRNTELNMKRNFIICYILINIVFITSVISIAIYDSVYA